MFSDKHLMKFICLIIIILFSVVNLIVSLPFQSCQQPIQALISANQMFLPHSEGVKQLRVDIDSAKIKLHPDYSKSLYYGLAANQTGQKYALYAIKIDQSPSIQKLTQLSNCQPISMSIIANQPIKALISSFKKLTSQDRAKLCISLVNLEDVKQLESFNCSAKCKSLGSANNEHNSFRRNNQIFYFSFDIKGNLYQVDESLNMKAVQLNFHLDYAVKTSSYCSMMNGDDDFFVIISGKDDQELVFISEFTIKEIIGKLKPIDRSLNEASPGLIVKTSKDIKSKLASKSLLIRIVYPISGYVYVYSARKENQRENIDYKLSVFYNIPNKQTLPANCYPLISSSIGIICHYMSNFLYTLSKDDQFFVSEKNWLIWYGKWGSNAYKSVNLLQCFLFNDCFGCVYLSSVYGNLTRCTWNGSSCVSSPVSSVSKCIRLGFRKPDKLWIGRVNNEPGLVQLFGVKLDNNYVKHLLKINDQTITSTSKSSDSIMFATQSIAIQSSSKSIALTVSIWVEKEKLFRSPIENIATNFSVFVPEAIKLRPNFALIGHKLSLKITFNENIEKYYTKVDVFMSKSGDKCSGKFENSGRGYDCKFRANIQSLGNDTGLIIKFGTYQSTVQNFTLKSRPICERIEPKALITNKSYIKFTVYGKHFNNTFNQAFSLRLLVLSESFTLTCVNKHGTELNCEFLSPEYLDEEDFGVFNLRTHGFRIDNFCPIPARIKIYQQPQFYETEYDAKSRIIYFRGNHFLIDFNVTISIRTYDGTQIAECIFLKDKSVKDQHQCSPSKVLDLNNKMKGYATIDYTEYDMGPIEYYGTAQFRRLIRNIVVGGILVALLIIVGLIIYASQIHYKRRHALKPHLEKLAKNRLYIRPSRFIPFASKAEHKSKAQSTAFPEPPSMSMSRGRDEFSQHFAASTSDKRRVSRE